MLGNHQQPMEWREEVAVIKQNPLHSALLLQSTVFGEFRPGTAYISETKFKDEDNRLRDEEVKVSKSLTALAIESTTENPHDEYLLPYVSSHYVQKNLTPNLSNFVHLEWNLFQLCTPCFLGGFLGGAHPTA
jgi:hypothetical protein